MIPPVSVRYDADIAIIVINHPPVNALSNTVRAGLLDAVEAADSSAEVTAIVISCAGRTFIAGADVTEFGKPRQPPALADLCNTVEACAKPVVAALHGTALGGGFEIALACHYRVAIDTASMGLPEVKLGLIPGAGGAARLARLAGARPALALTLKGDRLSASAALAQGIVDRVVGEDLLSSAIAFAREIIADGRGPRPTRAIDTHLAGDRSDLAAFDSHAQTLLARYHGQDAPAQCAASVRRALTMDIDSAIAADREAFAALSQGDQSRALRHVFFSERLAGKSDHAAPADLPSRVAILGAGTMGGGIAMAFAAAGYPVNLIDVSAQATEAGMVRIRANYANSVSRGSLREEEAQLRLARISPHGAREAAHDAQLVIEAVFEDMDLKREVFRDLERICAADTILATNTSALDVDQMAGFLQDPSRFVGMHFFSPANVMKLCEIVPNQATSEGTIATAMAMARAIGKVPVIAGNCDGFIGNRMVAKRSAQAERLLQEGALPGDVDAAIRDFGFPMGPLQTNDMSGLDVGYAIRKRRGTHFPIADRVAESGRLGQKTGAGYYRYANGSRQPVDDPVVAEIIEDVSSQLGIARRQIDRAEMIERMIFPLINEGARILEEGLARRPSDIDVVWIYGYGFPRWRGGPLFHADLMGLPYIVERLEAFAWQTGDASLEPAQLLTHLAATGSTFAQWQEARILSGHAIAGEAA
ncbi:hypothetical protein L284_12940 [Novosphingobium lindaniclasticum LE124]|uniref:3-hydroxyacyl-CoA dehydrogenase n=2 Tax=Novosphingobium TaxID=165696 RepID=T0IR35_9SPHN|nr:hypothetical protein L284_12940 [Novosphingobium lindaniclasticum LE124]